MSPARVVAHVSTRRLAHAALAAAVWSSAASAAIQSPSSARDTAWHVVARQDVVTRVRRPFAHRRHEDLPCRGCHGAGATHRTTTVRAPRDCAACHHDPARALACTTCHAAADQAPEQRVALTFPLRVANASVVREVAFRHDVHVARRANVPCRDCHGTAVTLQRNRECGSCHTEHHDGNADCARCHAVPRADAHDAAVHLTCAGAACHAASTAPSPARSRAVCLFCHADRREHEPEGSCAACHRIPGGSAPFSSAPSRTAGMVRR